MDLVGTRPPAVAGAFYNADPVALRAEVDGCLHRTRDPKPVLGVLVPHAGHRYSGALCGRALAAVEIPQRVLVLHSKHYPGGGALSLADYARWQTPLGEVAADESLTEALASLPGITPSREPHNSEHAAEVVLPFLQVLRPDARVGVISVGAVEASVLHIVASAMASVLVEHAPVLVIASSDMNHYEDQATTLRKDARALAAIEHLDAEALLEVCRRDQISMCGLYATALMLLVCRARGATQVRVLEHSTSAATSGDYNRTVGYATAHVW